MYRMNMKRMKSFSSLFVLLLVVVLIATACNSGKKSDESTGTAATEQTATATATTDNTSATAEETADPKAALRITTEPLTISIFQANQLAKFYNDYNEIPWMKEAEKLTGVHMNFIHPQSDDALNLMIASKNYSDII